MIRPSGRRWWLVAAVGVIGLLIWDLSRRPAEQASAVMLLTVIDWYQAVGSPLAERAGVRCRFEPTCSVYAERAIEARGAWAGGFASLVRLARCGPWTPAGALDPP